MGIFFNYNVFTNTFNVKCTKKQFSMVIKAIPQAMGNLVRGMLHYEVVEARMPALYIGELNFKERTCANKIIRGALTSELFPLPLKRKNMLKDYSKEIISILRTRYLTLYPTKS